MFKNVKWAAIEKTEANDVVVSTASALKRLKSYLRTTMSQERLNHVTVLNVHKERLDTVNTDKLTAEFVSRNDYRRSVFGQITCQHV